LVSFDPRDVPHHFADVLILGGGVAGLRGALGIDPAHRVLVITKGEVAESNSAYAQGGIASVMDPEDHFDDHIADTIAAGKGLCDPEIVRMVVREAPRRIDELIAWGTRFDEEAGQVTLGREGGHSHARIVHALGDATGREMMRAIISRARGLPHIRIWQNSFTLDLITYAGRCRGALVWDARRGLSLVWAEATLLATGGAGQLYRESTNPPIATADGHAMAYRAGAELRDMEFMQFHPTVLYIAGSSRHLLTEALRGEGAHLLDVTGRRFMPDYHPAAELAPRDDVSRAIVAQMTKTQQPCVFLSLAHLDPSRIRERFPGIDALCRSFDLDITRDRIPVRPGAHYYIGGVTVDHRGRTTIPGLWAAGEVTSSGLHGANRLASNSLLEGLVYGAGAADDMNEALGARTMTRLEVPPLAVKRAEVPARSERLDLADIRDSLRSLTWRQAGILRDARGLEDAAAQVERWCGYVLDESFPHPEGWTLQNLLVTARLLIASATERAESRGVHTRSDIPESRPEWQRHISCTRPRTPED
jgi:L-aspartate oxidase